MTASDIAARVETIDWAAAEAELDAYGLARLGKLLSVAECRAIRAMFDEDGRFRSHVTMARHGFGQGEYKYFAYPLPAAVERLRQAVYPHAARVANRWAEMLGETALGEATRYPARLEAMLARCRAAGQARPTPLLLRYRQGDYNRLHQDLYGALAFPLQLVVLLSAPGAECDGGEFLGGEFALTEQKPRSQSRVEVATLAQGEAALFAVNHRPAQSAKKGARGVYRATLRHGVSRLRSGERFALGVIFHDAA